MENRSESVKGRKPALTSKPNTTDNPNDIVYKFMLNDIKEENTRRSSIKHDLRHKFVAPLQIFEYFKDVVDRVFATLVQSVDKFPLIIKIYCALVQKHLK